MQISGGGPLGLLLMIAPLAAIPVFAIVGVPHFVPVAASGADEDEFADLDEASLSLPQSPTSAPAPARLDVRSADDLYAPVTEPPRSRMAIASPDRERRPSMAPAPGGKPRSPSRWMPPSEALDQWEVRADAADTVMPSRKNDSAASTSGTIAEKSEELETPGNDDDIDNGRVSADEFNPDLLNADRANPSKNRHRPPAPEHADALAASFNEQAGWQKAAQRLKKLGIRKFRLDSQIDEQRFVFTCSFTAPENPQVVRRFEADADNPLEAVQRVLEQIDEWRRGGAADQTEPLVDSEN